MTRRRVLAATLLTAAASLALWFVSPAQTMADRKAELLVAVTTPDIEAIVKQVGDGDVVTFPLFRGCILRRDLLVEGAAMDRLLLADAVIWTGFFNESSAIAASIEKLPTAQRVALRQPSWIDVSRDAVRVNVPTSSCDGYVEIQFMPGDPFFWLNPRNGRVIARNVAEGLARLRPDRRAHFAANAEDFSRRLDRYVTRWEQELRAMSSLRVFSAQCGWQNLAQLGGPTFLTCRQSPGVLDSPESLASQIDVQSVSIVIVDPNTPPQYAEVLRARTRAKVLTVPSSVADLPGAKTYPQLFENFIRALKGATAAN